MIALVLFLASAEPTDLKACFDHHREAQKSRRDRDRRAAVDCYERVFREQPSLHVERGMNLHFLHGEALWDMQRFDDAAQAYRKGYALDPTAPNAWESANNEVLARIEHDKLARTPAEKRARSEALIVALRAVLAHVDEDVLRGTDADINRMRLLLAERTPAR
jgi:hypothetical protein